MAPVSFIDDIVAACTVDELKDAAPHCAKMPLHSIPDGTDDEATTDVGQSSSSETESSSGLSGNEGCRSLGRRCRFGNTALETIPATPSKSAMPLNSPPGLSRAAMREARDAMKQVLTEDALDGQTSSCSLPNEALTGVTLSRFTETPFGTVPKTPVEKAKWKNLKNIFGSPPGLSRAEKRRARDSCKFTPASWGSCEELATAVVSGAGAAHDRLAKVKQDAARLKDMKVCQKGKDEGTHASSELAGDEEEQNAEKNQAPGLQCAASEDDISCKVLGASESSSTTAQNCRFDCTSLGTMPSTPAMRAAALASPPGLSRKAMRQARDSCRGAPRSASAWGTQSMQALTIDSSGKPMNPLAQRAAKQHAALDAAALGLCRSERPR